MARKKGKNISNKKVKHLSRWERVKISVNRTKTGSGTPEFTLEQCADYVAWIAKFKVLPPEEWKPVCIEITELFDEMRY